MAPVGRSDIGTPTTALEQTKADEGVLSALLATATVRIQLESCISPPLRALCDTGAMSNLISDDAVRNLKWPTQQCNVRLNGIHGITPKPHMRKLVCQLLSRFNDKPLTTIELVVGPELSNFWLPSDELPNIIPPAIFSEMADPDARTPAKIDILLGAGVWALIIQNNSWLNSSGIAFQPSLLGWLMVGGGASVQTELSMAVKISNSAEVQLDQLLRRFWEIKEVSTVWRRTVEQERCEEIFIQSYRRLPDGRFQVNIPLRNDMEHLGSSRAGLARIHFF